MSRARRGDRLRVATLNVWHRSADWPARRRVIDRYLRRLAPDLVGLQEVEVLRAPAERTAGGLDELDDQARDLAARRGMHLAFGAAHVRPRPDGTLREFGNALLSRYPITGQRVVPLPSGDRDEPRTVLSCRVASPAGVVPVFVTHLSWRLDDGATRLRQVRELAGIVEDTVCGLRAEAGAGDPFPALLLADLNAEPESDEVRYLTGLATVEGTNTRFADVWRYGGRGPGYTFDPANPHARATGEHARRIDYILVAGPDDAGRGLPSRPRTAFRRPVRGVHASDHAGVVVDLAAPPAPTGR